METNVSGDVTHTFWILAVSFTSAIVMTMTYLVVKARRMAKSQRDDRQVQIEVHRWFVHILDFEIFAMVVCVQALLYINGGIWVKGPIYWVHMLLVFSFVILWVTLHVKTGLKSKHHAKFAYTFVTVAVLTVTTGLWMLFQYLGMMN